ncbi:hypothetical protein J5N97_003549 [Dioscorea zingiberensis]|uniref:Methyl-CpG-binding domain-containing protein 2 n=1 Tax=Dioscorea zingiberensis TaxID=325984 RepID=A0A9D5D6T4_9LILI|nr:hypothetical protein J5N97_003549 [Dioscorea zingiberensis]
MVGFLSGKMKRKDVDEVSDEFSEFSLSSPARKIRRLDADLPPIMEEDEAAVPHVFQQQRDQQMRSKAPEFDAVVEDVPAIPANEERAIVLYKPVDSPLLLSPSSSNTCYTVSSDLFPDLKNQVFWRQNSNLSTVREVGMDNSLAVVPWVSRGRLEEECMDAKEDEGSSMEVEEVDEQTASTGFGSEFNWQDQLPKLFFEHLERFSERKACMDMNPGDGIPVMEVEQSVTPSSVRESQENSSVVSSNRSGGELANASPSDFNQIVLYNPDLTNNGQRCNGNHTSAVQSSPGSNDPGEGFGSFTVQCNSCFKWRIIPTKDTYEKIRASILQRPFVCDQAREWNRRLSCEDPTDITQDDSRLWAIDRPNIAKPPHGWQRLIRLRGEGGTRFADVYYRSPTGKKLRSMVEVERFLLENPIQGVHISQFSFQTPKPLREDYVRKRPRRASYLEPTEVTPLSWAPPFTFAPEEQQTVSSAGDEPSSSATETDPSVSI